MHPALRERKRESARARERASERERATRIPPLTSSFTKKVYTPIHTRAEQGPAMVCACVCARGCERERHLHALRRFDNLHPFWDLLRNLLVSGFGFQVSVFAFRVSGFGFRIWVSGFGFRFPVFAFRVSGFRFGFPVSGCGVWVSGSGVTSGETSPATGGVGFSRGWT